MPFSAHGWTIYRQSAERNVKHTVVIIRTVGIQDMPDKHEIYRQEMGQGVGINAFSAGLCFGYTPSVSQ